MLSEPLPSTLDVRKAAARGVTVSGTVRPLDLPRFRPLLAADEGSIRATLVCSMDEEHRYLVHVAVVAEVTVTCQRCLERMRSQLSSDNTLAVVWTDEQARHLPRHLDPLIIGDEGCRLAELVEDELILAMPAFSYHETDDCRDSIAAFSNPAPEEETDGDKPNPFNVLAQLKPGSNT